MVLKTGDVLILLQHLKWYRNTHTHTPQSHLLHTPSPNPLQTVPHAAHTMQTHTHHKPICCTLPPQTRSKLSHTQHTQCDIVLKQTVLRLLNWNVRSVLKATYIENKHVTVKLCNINIIIQQQPVFWIFWMFVGSKTQICSKFPLLEAQIQPDDTLLCN